MADDRSIRILLVKDGSPVKILLNHGLSGAGPTVIAVRDGEEAAELLDKQRFDVSKLDFELPGIGRIETRLRQADASCSELLVVVPESQPSTARTIAEALEPEGAKTEFLTMPLATSDLTALAAEAARQAGEHEADSLQPSDPEKIFFGSSAKMRELITMIKRVARGTASVLIHGETGSGKSIFAREIHAASPRAEERLVAINCGAFQDHLLESELFGHEKGSFTGAVATKQGLFEVAHRGTLFLDEITEMTTAMQAKLLQVLDEGELRRVGGTKVVRVDVRILAATNKNLESEVKAGRFREDLFFRLNVIQLYVPPLRERRDDIPGLVQFFLDRFQLPGSADLKTMSPEAMQLLRAYSWPGNVRELANTVEGLLLLAPMSIIRGEDLPRNLRPVGKLRLDDAEAPLPLSEIERLHIISSMRYTEGKKAPAARLLGIDVKTLTSKIRNYNIR